MCMRKAKIHSIFKYLYFNAKKYNLTCLIACDKRQYGLDCMQNCSANCMDGLCNNVNGHCNCTYGKKGSPYCNESTL